MQPFYRSCAKQEAHPIQWNNLTGHKRSLKNLKASQWIGHRCHSPTRESPSFHNQAIKNQPKGHLQKEEAIARHQREQD